MGIVFYIFAILSVISALGVVLAVNPVYSVLLLVFLFLNTAGLFVLINAEFLAVTLIVLYVGALAVVFLFVIMLINLNELKKRTNLNKLVIFSGILVFVFAIEVILLIVKANAFTNASASVSNLNSLGNIGIALYNNYFYVFLVLGVMLLITLIGVVMAIEPNPISNTYKQSMAHQSSVKPFSSVKLTKVNNKEGVK